MLAEELQDGLQQLGLELPSDAQASCLQYVDLLQRWNRVYNLTAVRKPADMLRQHLLDSLATLRPVERHLAKAARCPPVGPHQAAKAPDATSPPPRILDVGSGAGLPGIVLAIVHPDWSIACVDAVNKKVAFVQHVAQALGLKRLAAHHARVEGMTSPDRYDVITSRAFASLTDFVNLTRHLRTAQGVWLAMKGQRPDDEIRDLPADIEMFHVEQLHVPGLDAQRHLIWMQPKDLPTKPAAS